METDNSPECMTLAKLFCYSGVYAPGIEQQLNVELTVPSNRFWEHLFVA